MNHDRWRQITSSRTTHIVCSVPSPYTITVSTYRLYNPQSSLFRIVNGIPLGRHRFPISTIIRRLKHAGYVWNIGSSRHDGVADREDRKDMDSKEGMDDKKETEVADKEESPETNWTKSPQQRLRPRQQGSEAIQRVCPQELQLYLQE